MPRISFSELGDTPFERLLGHSPEVLKNWLALETAFYASGRFTPELREQVRRTLAHGNGCEYCMAKGRPDDVQPDARQGLAVAFADLAAKDHRAVSEQHFRVLGEEFDEEEVAEPCAFVCFITASQMFGALMDLKADAPA